MAKRNGLISFYRRFERAEFIKFRASKSLYSVSCTSHCIRERIFRNIITQIGGCSVKTIPAQMDNSCTLSENIEKLHYVQTPFRVYIIYSSRK